MRKIITLDEHFATGESTVQPLMMWGNNHRPLYERVKSASEASEYVKTVEPKPGMSIILVLALGAYEFYDLNRNGDGFNERPYQVGKRTLCGHPECQDPNGWVSEAETIIHHYKSFEEHGKIYKHHQNKDPLKSFGDIIKAFHNPQMHRIELLLGVRNDLAPDLAQRIADGEFLPVSMGCRIKWDVCTECGHRAPTRAKYCDCLKFAMRQVGKRGLRHGALNPSPKWFDISIVSRPADRTGYMLKKVAEHPYEIRTSSELGSYMDWVDQKKASLQKISDIDKIVRGVPVDHKTSPLSFEDGRALSGYQQAIAPAIKRMPTIDDATLGQLSKFPVAKTLSTLSAAGVILTTPEFIKLLLNKLAPGVQLPESTLDAIVGLQGQVFEMFAQNPQLLDQLGRTGMFQLNKKNVSAEIGGIAAKYLEKRSTISEYLNRSLVNPLMRKEEPPNTDTLTVRDPVTGDSYRTNRGAALAASDAVDKGQLAKMVGGAALLTGAYKVLASGLHGRNEMLKAPLAAGAGMLGYEHLRPDYGPQFMTDEGVAIPATTELNPVKSADELSNVALPIAGSAALVAALSHDYESRLRRGEDVNNPNAPLQTRLTDQLGSYAYDHPATSFMGGLGTAAAAKSILDKFAAYMGDLSLDGPSADGVTLPELDVDRAAMKIGSIVLP